MRLFFSIVLAASLVIACSKATVNNEVATATKATIAIEGMTCEMGCAQMIEKKLTALAGMSEAQVLFTDEKAEIVFDQSKITKEEIVSTIESLHGGDTYKVVAFEEKKESSTSGASKAKEEAAQSQKSTQAPILRFPSVFDFIARLLPRA